MDETPTDRCGYRWPENYEVVDSPDKSNCNNQSCCYRETVSDAKHCIWHVDPADTDVKTLENIPETRRGELLDGTILSGIEFNNQTNLSNIKLREAELSDARLHDADLSGSNLGRANLNNIYLYGANLSDANLVGANLSDANLAEANLNNATLFGADLNDAFISGATLRYSWLGKCDMSETNLTESDLTGAGIIKTDLKNSDLRGADLTNANLNMSDLTDVRLSNSNLTNAKLERATLIGVNLFDADLTGLQPYGARLTGVQINDRTKFDTNREEYSTAREELLFGSQVTCGYHRKLRENADLDLERQKELLAKSADTYRQFEELARNNTLPSLQSSMFVRRQDMQRSRHKIRDDHLEWAFAGISRALFKYGESLGRIFTWAIGLIVVYAVIYDLFDLIVDSDGKFVHSFVDALYFSTLTFTTLGLGDFQPNPVSQLARLLVTSQAALGAILIAIFVFVLGRRAAR